MTQAALRNRVLQPSTTTGTGSYTLSGTVAGYQTWAAYADGVSVWYCALDVNGSGVPLGDWEVGIGTLSSSSTVLSRAFIAETWVSGVRSTANTPVTWGAGTRRLFSIIPAHRALISDATGTTSSDPNFSTLSVDAATVLAALSATTGDFSGLVTLLAGLNVTGTVNVTGAMGVSGVGLFGANVLVKGPQPYVDVLHSDFKVSGNIARTTGSITSGTPTLVVASASGYIIGHGIWVLGAGASGGILETYITNIVGTTFTLNNNAGTSVTSAAVGHSDTRGLQAAIDFAGVGEMVTVPAGDYYISQLKLRSNMRVQGAGEHLTTFYSIPQNALSWIVNFDKTVSKIEFGGITLSGQSLAPHTIVGNTVANPTIVETATPHGIPAAGTAPVNIIGGEGLGGIAGVGSVPPINGTWTATYVDSTHFSIPVNVTADGEQGSVMLYPPTSPAGIELDYTDVNQVTVYARMHDLQIFRAPQHGIWMRNLGFSFWDHVMTSWSLKHGWFLDHDAGGFATSDQIHTACIAEASGWHGFYLKEGSDNIWNGCESYWSGQVDRTTYGDGMHLGDGTPYNRGTVVGTTRIDDNFRHGLVLDASTYCNIHFTNRGQNGDYIRLENDARFNTVFMVAEPSTIGLTPDTIINVQPSGGRKNVITVTHYDPSTVLTVPVQGAFADLANNSLDVNNGGGASTGEGHISVFANRPQLVADGFYEPLGFVIWEYPGALEYELG